MIRKESGQSQSLNERDYLLFMTIQTHNYKGRVLVSALFYIFSISSLYPVSIVKYSFSDIVKRSKNIYYAKFVNSTSDNTGRSFYFDVISVIKGDNRKNFIIKDQQKLPFRFLDSLKFNDTAIVFIRGENKKGFSIITGFNQGFVQVLKDANENYVTLDGKRIGVEDFINKIRENM